MTPAALRAEWRKAYRTPAPELKRVARRDDAQAEVLLFAEKYRKARTEKAKAIWLDEWHFEQKIFDIINDSLPERYKATRTPLAPS